MEESNQAKYYQILTESAAYGARVDYICDYVSAFFTNPLSLRFAQPHLELGLFHFFFFALLFVIHAIAVAVVVVVVEEYYCGVPTNPWNVHFWGIYFTSSHFVLHDML